jgi:hypothetical protein
MLKLFLKKYQKYPNINKKPNHFPLKSRLFPIISFPLLPAAYFLNIPRPANILSIPFALWAHRQY